MGEGAILPPGGAVVVRFGALQPALEASWSTTPRILSSHPLLAPRWWGFPWRGRPEGVRLAAGSPARGGELRKASAGPKGLNWRQARRPEGVELAAGSPARRGSIGAGPAGPKGLNWHRLAGPKGLNLAKLRPEGVELRRLVGPKGRNRIAQGKRSVALGKGECPVVVPKGRNGVSIPHVSLVAMDLVFCQELAELLLK